MTHILIIEDERPAGEYLKKLLEQLDTRVCILDILESVEAAVKWLCTNPAPDLLFLDVQLGDGTCFEIFEQVTITCPVVFTTAHDEYALRAFKLNSIDYLLKPIKPEALRFSLDKFYQLNDESMRVRAKYLEGLIQSQVPEKKAVRRSFLVPYRDKLIPLNDEQLAWLTIRNGVVVGTLHDDRTYPIDKSLEELESQLDSRNFFRANRQFIIARSSIRELELYFNGRLLVRVNPTSPNLILISKERVPVFKKWFEDPL